MSATTQDINQAEVRLRHARLVEQCLPAHILHLTLEKLPQSGIEVRKDVIHNVNVASVSKLANEDPFTIRATAQKTHDLANILLRDLNADSPVEAVYCVCAFILLLVDEGVFADAGNQAVLSSLVILDELKSDNQDSVWRYEEQRLTGVAKTMLRRAQLLGYYLPKNTHKINPPTQG